jgi:signal peptidase I
MEMNKKHNITGHLVQILLLSIWILFCVAAFGNRLAFLANNNMRFFDVMSGSMAPAIPTGSLIKSNGYILEDLQKDDIITFQSKGGAIVTHRIVKVDKKETPKSDGGKIVEYHFVTKGDANNSLDDEIVESGQILGEYKWHIPYLGYATSMVKTTAGFVAFVLVPGVFLVIIELWLLVLGMKKDMEAKLKEQHHAHTTE